MHVSKVSNKYKLLETNSTPNINARTEFVKKVGSAIFYGIASFLITVVNKTVLTTWGFPSFLVISVGQMAAQIIILYMGKKIGIISFPDFSLDIIRKIFPLPLIYFGNMMFGLGGTQALPLPMFSAIRRFSIPMTMLLELQLLGIRSSLPIQISVWCMVGGALLAASDDLTFTIRGYTYVMIANAMSAANGVYLKKTLSTIDVGVFGIMFYNSLVMFAPGVLGAWLTGDLQTAYNFQHWSRPIFCVQIFFCYIMGLVLTYSTILCTQHNSALTTTIIGCLKNILVTYAGMFIGGDYIFSWLNCIGINIGTGGSLVYTYITFGKKERALETVAHGPTSV